MQLRKLRRDSNLLHAAERHEPVSLQHLVKKYVPLTLQTGRIGEEIAVAKEQVGRNIAYWRMAAGWLVAVTLLIGFTAVMVARRSIVMAPPPQVSEAELPLDAFSLLPGAWGWKFDFERSCAQNPHTISVSDKHDRIEVTFKKPLWDGGKLIRTWEYDVLEQKRRGLSLALVVPKGERSASTQPPAWDLILDDKNTYHMRPSNQPTAIVGTIERCPAERATGSP